jgi:rhombotail lipoprotein
MRRSFVLSLVALILIAGCSYSRNIRRSSNLMDFLYPNADRPPEPEAMATLQLPLRVGIAFVPGAATGDILGGGTEQQLLDTVRKAFEGRDWVREVVIIPSNYLQHGGGFANLDQAARLFNVDVVALASIDQIQHSEPTKLSFLYISIIGAHVLPLDRNDTRTLIDVAVFDVPTRTFLLRAPGQSYVKGTSTAMDVNETLRDKSLRGLKEAMADLTTNLDAEVDRFKERVIAGDRKDVTIVNKEGESIKSSGSFGVLEVLGALALAAYATRRSRWAKHSR